jgi:hypothetical protein
MRDSDVDALVNIMRVLASSGLTQEASLCVLELAWIAQASSIRSAAALAPGGFSAAKATQVGQLEKLTELVRGGVPDLDQQRLWAEGDFKGYQQHLLGQLLPRRDQRVVRQPPPAAVATPPLRTAGRRR